MTPDWDFNELLLPVALWGMSLMIAMVPISNIALGTLPPEKMKGTYGLFNLTRNLGGAVRPAASASRAAFGVFELEQCRGT